MLIRVCKPSEWCRKRQNLGLNLKIQWVSSFGPSIASGGLTAVHVPTDR